MNIFKKSLPVLLLLSSCEKEIHLPYRSIEPLVVIEGKINQDTAYVRVSRTRDMDDGDRSTALLGADVRISVDGEDILFRQDADSVYRPSVSLKGVPGKTYTLGVKIGAHEYSSVSSMMDTVRIDSFGFRSIVAAGVKVWLYSASFQDIPGDNYYVYFLYKDGKVFAWDLFPDIGFEGGRIPIDIPVESDEEARTGEAPHDTIRDGESVRLEVRTVDRRTYDYMYSAVLTWMSSSNPVANFTTVSAGSPRALGYFSASSSVWRTSTLHLD